MKVNRKFFATFGYWMIPIGVVVLSHGGLFLYLVGFFNPACETRTEKRVTDLPGFDFEIRMTGCWGTSYNSVLVSRKGERRQTTLFEYGQIDWIDLPTIGVPEKDKIVIAAPRASAVFARRDHWRGMRIEYEIGKIDYPDSRVTRLDDEN